MPVQTVDATPSGALIRQCFRGRTICLGGTRSKPGQGNAPTGLALASDCRFSVQCEVDSSLVLRRPIEIAALTEKVKCYFKWRVTRPIATRDDKHFYRLPPEGADLSGLNDCHSWICSDTSVFSRSSVAFSHRRRSSSSRASTNPARPDLRSGLFYKGRSQEKTHLLRLEFFLASQPT